VPSDSLGNLSLLVLVLPAHGRVALLLTPAPGRHDSALHRRMGLCDGTLARGDVYDHAIHVSAGLPLHLVTDEKEGRTRPPPFGGTNRSAVKQTGATSGRADLWP